MKTRRNKNQHYIVSFDKYILLTYCLLCLVGLITLLDISSVQSSLKYFYRQLFFGVISIITAITILYTVNLEKLRVLSPYFVYIAIILLIIVLLKGNTVKGATRQLSFGFVNFQPSVLARLALVYYFAHILDKKNDELVSSNLSQFVVNFLALLIVTGITFLLIIMERHLSTLIIGGLTIYGMLIYAGAKKRVLVTIALIGIIAAGLILANGADYRKGRLTTYKKFSLFLKPQSEIKIEDSDYQVKESLTALSSGGLLGTGIARGRAKHYYLPEARTDYIYSVIGEEWGFLGALIVFGLHCFLFFRCLWMANAQENRFLRFLGVGLAMNIFCNVLVNTGVAMSILPPTGNTLPFISYGGSALLIDSIALGMLLNISAKRRYV